MTSRSEPQDMIGDRVTPQGSSELSPVQLKKITDYDEFLGLRHDWDALSEHAPEDLRVFLRHAWFDACWPWATSTGEPLVLAISRNEKPLAFIPLLTLRRKRNGLNLRELEFLAVPDTQFGGIVVHPDLAATACDTFADWLTNQRTGWDHLRLRNLREDDPVSRTLRRSLRSAGLPVDDAGTARNHRIDLAGTWEDYYGTRSRRLKKGNNLVANRLRRAGTVSIHHLAGEKVTDQALEAVREVSATSWKRNTGLTLDATGPGAFLERLAAHNARERWLSVWMLTLDERVIATELQLQANGRIYALRADYRGDSVDLSPGTYLNWKILEALFGEGLATYFMGPGDNTYKFRWTEDYSTLTQVRAWNRTPRGRLYAFLELRLKPFLRSTRARLISMRRRNSKGT